MATFEMKDGQATLFKNTQKEKEKHPDFKGKAMLGDNLYYLSFWSKKTDKGMVWLSGTIQSADKVEPVDEAEKDDFMATTPVSSKTEPAIIPAGRADDLPF